jgi:hypothetical protein
MISVILLTILSVGEVDLEAAEDSGEGEGEREAIPVEVNETENDSISACSLNASRAIKLSSRISSEGLIFASDPRIPGLGSFPTDNFSRTVISSRKTPRHVTKQSSAD